MFRTSEINKVNENIDHEDSYEFKGATLKISDDDETISSLRYRGTHIAAEQLEQSAILSGSDPSLHEDYPSTNGNYNNGKQNNTANEPISTDIPGDYFAFRNGQFEKAIENCLEMLLRPYNDTNVLGSWLLTEVSHWDTEKERLFILTTKSFIQIKYDFIALRILQYNRVRLEQVDTILRGKLTYPVQSLVPRIEGITNGVASLLSGTIFGFGKKSAPAKSTTATVKENTQPKMAVAQRFDFSSFRPVDRKDIGVRLLWNKGQPPSVIDSWNPFSENIPWVTIKDHPLYAAIGPPSLSSNPAEEFEKKRNIYSAESLYNELIRVFSASNPESINFNCCFEDCPILMENYVGIGAVIHNKNNFGFFKCRGKFSF